MYKIVQKSLCPIAVKKSMHQNRSELSQGKFVGSSQKHHFQKVHLNKIRFFVTVL